MGCLQYPISPVLTCCWACYGTGFHLVSAQPIKFRRCWMCYGARGITAKQEGR